jgi:hypothetical protein
LGCHGYRLARLRLAAFRASAHSDHSDASCLIGANFTTTKSDVIFEIFEASSFVLSGVKNPDDDRTNGVRGGG